jgi:hypothetical protein
MSDKMVHVSSCLMILWAVLQRSSTSYAKGRDVQGGVAFACTEPCGPNNAEQ